MPLFSIVISTYNAKSCLANCLDSILTQRLQDWEILLVDGGSTDGTVGVIQQYSDNIAFSVSEPDDGIYDAWNKALPHLKGDWVVFLGADDVFASPDVLAQVAELVQSELPDDISLIYGLVDLIDPATGDMIEQFGTGEWGGLQERLDSELPFSHTGLFHRRSLFRDHGAFDSAYRITGDYEFLLRAMKDPGVKASRVPFTVAHMAAGGISSSLASRLLTYREAARARRSHGLFPAPVWLAGLWARSLAAFLLHKLFGARALLLCSNMFRHLVGKRPRRSLS